jgi:hypothetical protein
MQTRKPSEPYGRYKKYNDDEERRLPISGRKPGAGRMAKLTQGHS